MKARRYITEEDVRDYMKDRTAADHDLFTDVIWTSEEIQRAMATAAREFNSISPYVVSVDPARLPGDTNLFLDGIAAALLRRMRTNDGLNDLDYSAGNMQVKVTGTRIQHVERLIQMYDERFQNRAKEIKRIKNMRQAFGAVG